MTGLRIALLIAACLAAAALVRALPRGGGDRRWTLRRRPAGGGAAAVPAGLAAIERTLWMATASAHDRHHRLAPLVRGIAAQRLSTYRGVDLHDDPERARSLLGPVAWELVRPDRPEPANRFARGARPEELEELVAALERLADAR
ncbi:MAG TPA: hypothetical protein VMU66_04575 [Gaiellales bacterium]|nr:hypothetical protein [Gaiellales bacterium]